MAEVRRGERSSSDASAVAAYFDSPQATSANKCMLVVSLLGVLAATATLAADLSLGGASHLDPWLFALLPLIVVPTLWGLYVRAELIGRSGEERPAPRRRVPFDPRGIGDPLRRLWPGLPSGFLGQGEVVAMACVFAVGFLLFVTASDSAPKLHLGLLGLPWTVAGIATIFINAERRRRANGGLASIAHSAQRSRRPRGLAESRPLIAWLLIGGVAIGGFAGVVAVTRANAYFYGVQRLIPNKATVVSLPGGNDVILVGYLGAGDAAPFGPSQVSVVSVRSGRQVRTYWDTSGDHDSPDEIPSAGLVEFRPPADGRYRVSVAAPAGLTLFVQRSPGDEWRLLAPWIVATLVGLALLVAGITGIVLRIRGRARAATATSAPDGISIEEWMSRPHTS